MWVVDSRDTGLPLMWQLRHVCDAEGGVADAAACLEDQREDWREQHMGHALDMLCCGSLWPSSPCRRALAIAHLRAEYLRRVKLVKQDVADRIKEIRA